MPVADPSTANGDVLPNPEAPVADEPETGDGEVLDRGPGERDSVLGRLSGAPFITAEEEGPPGVIPDADADHAIPDGVLSMLTAELAGFPRTGDSPPTEVGKEMDHNSDEEISDSCSPDRPVDLVDNEYSDRDAIHADDTVDAEDEDLPDLPPDDAQKPPHPDSHNSSNQPGDKIAKDLGRLANAFGPPEWPDGPARLNDDAHPEPQPSVMARPPSEDSGNISDGGPENEIHDDPPADDTSPQDAHEPADDQELPADRPPTRLTRDPAETPSLLEAAREHMSPDDREFIEKQIKRFVTGKSEGARQDAYDKIQMRAATVVATAIVREVTDRNLRQAYRDGLYEWIGDNFTNQRSTSAPEKERRKLANRFLYAMRNLVGDVVREVAKELLIEMLFPGAHIVIPPTGLVDAILAACTLLKIADDTH